MSPANDTTKETEMTIDANGTIHDTFGRFDGHTQTEVDTVAVLPAPAWQINGREEFTGNPFKAWSEIHDDYKYIREDGTKVVLANLEGIGTCSVPWQGDGAAMTGLEEAPADQVDADGLMSTSDLADFGYAAVEEQHDVYQNSKGRRRDLAAQRSSMIRTKRLALLVADRFPRAVAVEIEMADEDGECGVNAVIMADGSRISDWSDDRYSGAFEEMGDEAFDIYDNVDGWKGCATVLRNGPCIIHLRKAAAISAADLDRGFC